MLKNSDDESKEKVFSDSLRIYLPVWKKVDFSVRLISDFLEEESEEQIPSFLKYVTLYDNEEYK